MSAGSSNAREKGTALEEAVRAIESVILRTFPSYDDKTFHIEGRKIIQAHGVRHEVDIWVHIDLPDGYDSTFIFECRNRMEKADKNDIIVFSEKIGAAGAHRGFFIARSFTADARAQATKDPRLKLLVVSDLTDSDPPVPFGFHFLNAAHKQGDVAVEFRIPGKPLGPIEMDVATTHVRLDGEQIDFGKYVRAWLDEMCEARSLQFPSQELEQGEYEVTAEESRTFQENQLQFDGRSAHAIRMRGTFRYQVLRPAIISYFDIERRGRMVKFAPVDFGSGKVQIALALAPSGKQT